MNNDDQWWDEEPDSSWTGDTLFFALMFFVTMAYYAGEMLAGQTR